VERIIDLTRTLEPEMPGFDIEPAMKLEADGWNATTLTIYSHCGTHMDAPRHFLTEGRTIDLQPLNACIGPAKILNLTPVKPKELLTVERLGAYAETIRPGDRLLLRTDWSLRHGTSEFREALPRISSELASWLVDRQVVFVGVEPPSVADVSNIEELTMVHQTLLEGGIVIVEGLTNLDAIRAEVVEIVVLPLKVGGGDGAPVRAVAIEHVNE